MPAYLSVLILASGVSFAATENCEVKALEPLLAQFSQAQAAEDCEARLKALKVHEDWLKECERARQTLFPAFTRELFRRTTMTFKSLESKEGRTFAVVEIRGPSWFEFSDKLRGGTEVGDCLVKPVTLFAEETTRECGEAFWKSIPLETKGGALPLACENGAWRIESLGEPQ